MVDDTYVAKCLASLLKRQERFANSEEIARGGLDAIQEEVQRKRIPDLKVVGRSHDELLLTLAGRGFFFRFAYTTTKGFISYGTWITTEKGRRVYQPVLKWEIKNGWIGPAEGREDRQKLLYIALEEVFTALHELERGQLSDLLFSRYYIREFDSGAAVSADLTVP
jgi:hypothetical protein